MPASQDYLDKGLSGLVALMDLLRSPEGCPWDAEQTHESLKEFLLEETYELLDAFDSEKPELIKEELGDLLLQIVFHARIAEESTKDKFNIDDVANGITAKLISRHPHVFESKEELDPKQVKDNWEKLKAKEKNRQNAFEGVPSTLPALLLASKILNRIVKYNLDFNFEVTEPIKNLLPNSLNEEELGQILLQLVKRSKSLGLEPENALRKAVMKLDS